MGKQELQTWLKERAEVLGLPGVAVGVLHNCEEIYACHGVTSVANPLPVDENTIFEYGSTHKTYTSTAILRLVEQGKIDLDARVRTYVPELKLKDESVAENVTVLHLLNHTAGWSGDAHEDFGDGDDALERFVGSMPKLEQVFPLGSDFSYNNASLNLAGHVIAKVTGQTYEAAMQELLYEPLGLSDTLFFPNEVMTRRFAVGHRQEKDGAATVVPKWAMSRCAAPAGGFGVSSTIRDQIAWARFHLGDGTAPDGTRVLSKDALDRMKQPTRQIGGSALGDGVGISWFLRTVDGVLLCSHGGDVIGQHSEFVMCPERNFAVAVLTNCDSSGSVLKDEAVKFALEHFIGVVDTDPDAVPLPVEELEAYVGRYETIAVWVDITTDAPNGGLMINIDVKPEMRAQLQREGEEVPEQPAIPFGFLPGEPDRYIVTDGPAKGMRGYFSRGSDGTVEAAHIGGRLATRVKTPVPA